jgi:PDDEXK-like domain of unknown function (DUF3799)
MNFDALCHGEPVHVEPGLHLDVSRDTYNNIPALSSSVIKKWIALQEIPDEFEWWLSYRWKEPQTESLLIGSALDCMLIDNKFSERFAVVPACDRRTSVGKAIWSSFQDANQGKTMLSAEQFQRVSQMAASLRNAPAADGVLSHCQKVVLVGELFGLPWKAEIDLWNEEIPHILDLKTARDVSPKWFVKASIDLGYDIQACSYLLLAQSCGYSEKKIFSFVAVKNEEPWSVKIHNFAPFEDPDHRVIFEGNRARLASAANELAARLEKMNFAANHDWELMRFSEWTLRQAKMDALAAA